MKKRIICISDTHLPYQHKDTFRFLKAIRDEYAINLATHVGDVFDNHYPSYHEKEAGCLGGSEEIRESRKAAKKLEELFPELYISEGNHDILPKRKANSAQVPLEWVATPNRVYGLEGGWKWDSHHYIPYGDNLSFLLVHSVGANTRTNATRYSHSSVQGHHHSEFCISYQADTDTLRWSMSVGCLIDPHSPAFRYDKQNFTRRPILGCGIILEQTPILIPMTLTKSGRWNKRLPSL